MKLSAEYTRQKVSTQSNPFQTNKRTQSVRIKMQFFTSSKRVGSWKNQTQKSKSRDHIITFLEQMLIEV
jgi:hypothetical protein